MFYSLSTYMSVNMIQFPSKHRMCFTILLEEVLHCLGARTPLPVVLHPLQARFSKVGVNEPRDGRGKKTIAITAVGGTGVSEVC